MLNARILVVDDEPKIRKVICEIFALEGARVQEAGNGNDAIRIIETSLLDLVVLDLGLPDVDGISLAKIIINRFSLPILMLTGRGHISDKVIGLESGAEDYVTKPFHSLELIARAKTILSRRPNIHLTSPLGGNRDIAKFDGWILNQSAGELISPAGELIILTAREHELLALFVNHPSIIITRDHMAELNIGKSRAADSRTFDVMIGKLRKKLQDNSSDTKFIQTVRNRGYKFTCNVEFLNSRHIS